MNPKNLFFFFLILLFTQSCRKDDRNIDDGLNPCFAGVYDSTYIYTDINAFIPIEWDSDSLYGRGSLTTDIDMDDLHDIEFTIELINSDSADIINYTPELYPSFKCQTSNEIDILVYTEVVYTGMGGSNNAIRVKALEQNYRIDQPMTFASFNTSTFWIEFPVYATAHHGEFYSINEETYFGFRFKGSRFGWIKIDMTDKHNPYIVSCAVQK